MKRLFALHKLLVISDWDIELLCVCIRTIYPNDIFEQVEGYIRVD